jgi:hypothetical protein
MPRKPIRELVAGEVLELERDVEREQNSLDSDAA